MNNLKIICDYFQYPKKRLVLENSITQLAPQSNHKKLLQLCPTRWCDKHESLIVFVELFIPLVRSLEELSAEKSEGQTRPENLVNTLTRFEFIVGIHVLKFFAKILL